MSAKLASTLRSLPAPNEPTCCLYCDFEDAFAGDTAAQYAEAGTDRILSLLDRHKLRITFNVVAELCHTHPERVCRIRDAGHEIACHGYRHERPRDLSRKAIDNVLREAGQCFGSIGVRPSGFRSPESAWSVDLLPALARHGFRWNAERDPARRAYRIHAGLVRVPIRTDDWDLTDPAGDVRRLLARWTDGATKTCDQGLLYCVGVHEWILGARHEFAEALDQWIRQHMCAGWRFRSMADMLDQLKWR